MTKSFFRRAIPVLLAGLLLWYVLRSVPFQAIQHQFLMADYGWLLVTGSLILLFYTIRAGRWKITLQAIGYRPSLLRATVALLAGSLASMIVPGAGELTRCGSLQRTDGIPIAQGLGSVVAERIIDVFMLLLVLLLTTILEFKRAVTYLASLSFAVPGTMLILGGVLAMVVAGLVIWQFNRYPSLKEHPLLAKLINVGQGFGRGFMAIRQLPNPGLFIALTLLIQVIAWLSTYTLLRTTSDTSSLPPVAALTIVAVSSLGGLAVPTQGGIGTYHFFVSRALVLYGFTATQGAVTATYLHAVGFGFNLLLSSISFFVLPFLITQRVPHT